MASKEEGQEFFTCTYLQERRHYTDFNRAGWGWLAIDGTKRHQMCKDAKRIKNQFNNRTRVWVDGNFVCPANLLHPFHQLYIEGGYEAVFAAMNLQWPSENVERCKMRGNRSQPCDDCMDDFGVPDDDLHREVPIGRYRVDGLIGDTVYEFYGTYAHGDPRVYQPDSIIYKQTAAQKWKWDQEREKFIVESGYKMVLIWEVDWMNYKAGISDGLVFDVRLPADQKLHVGANGIIDGLNLNQIIDAA